MKELDGRHRWGLPVREGARITHTCTACGRTQTFETIVPDALFEELTKVLIRPNPYRAMFR